MGAGSRAGGGAGGNLCSGSLLGFWCVCVWGGGSGSGVLGVGAQLPMRHLVDWGCCCGVWGVWACKGGGRSQQALAVGGSVCGVVGTAPPLMAPARDWWGIARGGAPRRCGLRDEGAEGRGARERGPWRAGRRQRRRRRRRRCTAARSCGAGGAGRGGAGGEGLFAGRRTQQVGGRGRRVAAGSRAGAMHAGGGYRGRGRGPGRQGAKPQVRQCIRSPAGRGPARGKAGGIAGGCAGFRVRSKSRAAGAPPPHHCRALGARARRGAAAAGAAGRAGAGRAPGRRRIRGFGRAGRGGSAGGVLTECGRKRRGARSGHEGRSSARETEVQGMLPRRGRRRRRVGMPASRAPRAGRPPPLRRPASRRTSWRRPGSRRPSRGGRRRCRRCQSCWRA
jgi:hypothetical protein